MPILRPLLALIAAGLLAGCQISSPTADPVQPGPSSIAYVPGRLPPPPSTGWTTPQGAEARPLSRSHTVRILGLSLDVPDHVIRMTEEGRDGRVGDAVERRTRVSSLYGGPPEFILTYRTVYQWGTDLHDGAGTAPDLWSNLVRVSWEQPLPVFGRFGLYGEYTRRDYEFSGRNDFVPGTNDPWGSTNRFAIGANLFQPVHEKFAIFLATDVRWHAEEGADLADGFTWSVTMGAGYRPSDKLDLGVGFIVSDSFGDELYFIGGPQFDWRPTDRWRIALTGTEVEIQYELNRAWQLGGGGGFTGHRFRLRDDGPAPNQIASESRFPIYVQMRYRGIDDLDLTWRMGADITREFSIEDSAGNTLRTYESDPSPYVSFRAIWRF